MSTIKLYRNCKILEDNNWQVESIGTYLNSLSGTRMYDPCQLVRNVNDLDIVVKVALDQEYLEKSVTNNYNYASISNDGSTGDTYYYFIKKFN